MRQVTQQEILKYSLCDFLRQMLQVFLVTFYEDVHSTNDASAQILS